MLRKLLEKLNLVEPMVPPAPEAIVFDSEPIKKTVKKTTSPKTAKKPIKKATTKKSK
jgi:hypothetical protein